MLAKLIVTGATRTQALQRARRALAEIDVAGLPTVLPFHRAVVADPAFSSDKRFGVHTRWIETEFVNSLPAWSGEAGQANDDDERRRVTVEVGGKRLEVVLPAGLGGSGNSAASNGTRNGGNGKGRKRSRSGASAAATGDDLTSPMQGTIVKVAVEDGTAVREGDLVVVLEAMKMEQPLTAHKSGTVSGLTAVPGATVSAGAVIASILD